ncbi:MAG: 16S rRNA (guanine(527)-N(7))-methyltransferase RsmG [Pseudomonadota bacterium]
MNDFDCYASLLLKWNRRINLISAASADDLWARHFADSAQIARFSKKNGLWLDVGSGGGFPAIVVAILSKTTNSINFTLVESDARKCAFLRTVARELQLNVTVLPERIENLAPLCADIISARALANLIDLLVICEKHLLPSGLAVFLKGQKVDAEIEAALEHWRFDCQKHQSMTDANSSVLTIGAIARA